MKIIVLDLSTAEVHIYECNKHCQSEEMEAIIEENGHRLQDCDWMSAEELSIQIH